MIRRGKFVVFQGVEYRAGKRDEKSINILSTDPADQNRGFEVFEPGVLRKTVSRDHISAAFMREYRALYRGREVAVMSEKGGQLELFTSGWWPELEFSAAEPGWYQKWVRPEELERLWEVCTPL